MRWREWRHSHRRHATPGFGRALSFLTLVEFFALKRRRRCGMVRRPPLQGPPMPNRLPHRPLAALLIACAPALALAEPVRYDYAELAFAGDSDLRGASLRGGFDFAEAGDSGFYLQGHAFSLSGEEGAIDVDRRVFDAGVGYRHAIGDFWALEGELAYRDDTRERRGFADDEARGARLSVGVRGSVSERVEIRAVAGAFDAGDRGTETVGEVGVHVYATTRLGFTTDVQFGDGGEVLRIGVRVRF
jgi:hypothetical protein